MFVVPHGIVCRPRGGPIYSARKKAELGLYNV